MYDKDQIKVLAFPYSGFFRVAVFADGETLWKSEDLYLDKDSAKGAAQDIKDALKDSMCLWCGEPLNYVTEIDGLDIFGFCGTDCQAEALKEAHDEEMVR